MLPEISFKFCYSSEPEISLKDILEDLKVEVLE